MLKRWGVPLATLATMTASAGAAIAVPAAVPVAPGPARHSPARHGQIQPGGTAAFLAAPGAAAPGNASTGATGPARGRAAWQATSTNWSGYVATGRAYTSVSATWVQPPVSCGPGGGYASFWVGLDGYASGGTVEQVGTDSDCSGRPRYYGWYEMYPGPSHNVRGAIGPGDTVRASVTYTGGGAYALRLADESRGWSATVTRSLPGAARSSAEVIVEAPSDSGGILPLARFGTVRVGDARADGVALGAYSPTRITMADGGGGAAKATVSPLGNDGNFRVTWKRTA